MNTNIGAVALTNNQILNFVPVAPWERFSYIGGEVIAVSETQPQQSDIDSLKAQLAALPDVVPQSIVIANFSFKQLWGTVWAGDLSQIAQIELPPYQTAIESMWNYPNRSAVYPYMQALVQAGKGTAGDLAIIVAAFSDQGIDIITIT